MWWWWASSSTTHSCFAPWHSTRPWDSHMILPGARVRRGAPLSRWVALHSRGPWKLSASVRPQAQSHVFRRERDHGLVSSMGFAMFRWGLGAEHTPRLTRLPRCVRGLFMKRLRMGPTKRRVRAHHRRRPEPKGQSHQTALRSATRTSSGGCISLALLDNNYSLRTAFLRKAERQRGSSQKPCSTIR